jgi:hypothetical protein
MAPGIVAITVFEHQLEKTIQDPGADTFLVLFFIVSLIIVGGVTTKRWLGKKSQNR